MDLTPLVLTGVLEFLLTWYPILVERHPRAADAAQYYAAGDPNPSRHSGGTGYEYKYHVPALSARHNLFPVSAVCTRCARYRVAPAQNYDQNQLRVIEQQIWARIVRIAQQLAQIFQRWLLVDQMRSLCWRIIPQTTQVKEQMLMSQRDSQLFRRYRTQRCCNMHDPKPAASLRFRPLVATL